MTATIDRVRTTVPLTGIVLAAVITPYLWLAAYANPGADDLTYALDTRRDGYWVALRDQYFLWNGRYASNLFELGGPMVWGSIVLYKMVVLVTILATFGAMYTFIRGVVAEAWTPTATATAAFAVTAIFLWGVPVPGETIYWYTGAVTYQWSAIMLLLLAALMVSIVRDPGRATTMRVIVATFLTFGVVFSHVTSLAFGLSDHLTWWTAVYPALAASVVAPSLFPWSRSANKPALFLIGVTFATLTLLVGSVVLLARL